MKRFFALVLALVMTLSLAACGGQSGETTSEDDASQGSEGGYQELVVIGSNGQIITDDPQAQSNVTHAYMFQCTHEKLTYWNWDTESLEPGLATSWDWRDDTTLEVKLDTTTTFHNGEKLTAEDVVYSFERIREMYPGNAGTIAAVTEFVAESDDTVLFKMDAHLSDLPSIFSSGVYYIVNKKACTEDPEHGAAIGTGPYMIEEVVPSEVAHLVAYEDFRDGTPKTPRIDITYVAETSARLISLQTGEIDVCIQPNNNELDLVREDPNLQLIERDSPTHATLIFNTQSEVFSDVNARLAVAYALSQEDIITVAVEGYGEIAANYWAPQTFGYTDEYSYDGVHAYGQDLEKAKEYAEKAGLTSFHIAVSTTERAKMAQAIQAMMAEIDVEVIVDNMETAAINNAMAWDNPQGFEAGIYNSTWAVHGDSCRSKFYPEQSGNRAHLVDERVIELIDKAAVEPDEAKRIEMYHEIQKMNTEQCWYYPMFLNKFFAAAKAGVEGVIWSNSNSHDFKGIYIEK